MQKILLMVLLLPAAAFEARAQSCTFTFPSLSVCIDSSCIVQISMQPSGSTRVWPDNQYGTRLGINFGADSTFHLGDNGRINFGNSGGTEAVLTGSSTVPVCRTIGSGRQAYTVDMSNGGWLEFSGNNRIELNPNNAFVLRGGSKISGRLDIQSDGTVGILSNGEMTLPNVDINAAKGIMLSGQGDIQIGNLENQGTPSSNQGIDITTNGDVEIGIVDSNDDFSVMAGGNISIEEIRNADSISLTITPPATGIIKIGGQQTTDNPVMCAPTDDCSGFQLDGSDGSGANSCNTVNANPDAASECPSGGAAGPGFVLLCVATLLLRRRDAVKSRPKN